MTTDATSALRAAVERLLESVDHTLAAGGIAEGSLDIRRDEVRRLLALTSDTPPVERGEDGEILEALKLCAAVLSGADMHKNALVRALEVSRKVLAARTREGAEGES